MINRQKTLKLIKAKVDEKTSRQIRLKKPVKCHTIEGIGIKRKIERRIVKLVKNGNTTDFIDDAYYQGNINDIADVKELHQLMWSVITESEKKEIALEHLLLTKTYLN